MLWAKLRNVEADLRAEFGELRRAVHPELALSRDDVQERTANVFVSRFSPLVQVVDRTRAIAWFAAGLATAAIFVAIAMSVVMAGRGGR